MSPGALATKAGTKRPAATKKSLSLAPRAKRQILATLVEDLGLDEGDLGHPVESLAITPFSVSDLGASAPMSVALHVPQAPEHDLPQDAVGMKHTLDPVPQAPEHVPVNGVDLEASTDTQAALPRVAGSTNLEILHPPTPAIPTDLVIPPDMMVQGSSQDVDSIIDQICNEAYDQSIEVSTPPKILTVVVPVSQRAPDDFPMGCSVKDFPLTKLASKLIRLGVDAKNMTPFVLLMGDIPKSSNKIWLRITVDELKLLYSSEVQNHILSGMQNRSLPQPFPLGSLQLSLVVNKNFTTVCIEKKDVTVKLYLGESSWKMIHALKDNFEYHLIMISELASMGSDSWNHFISHLKHYCYHHNYKTPQSILELSEEHSLALVTKAAKSYLFQFPPTLKLDLMSYHLDFLKENIFTAMRQD